MKLFIFIAFIVATMATIYQSERLLDQSIDQLELELAAKEEKILFFQNDLDEVMFVNWDCDQNSLKQRMALGRLALHYALGNAERLATKNLRSWSNTEKKEWTYRYMSRRLSPFTKIQPHSFKEETLGLDCKSVFVDVWTVKSNGEVNGGRKSGHFRLRETLSMDLGEKMIVSGTADKPLYNYTYEVCGGDKCGCVQGRCWKTCMGISKCDTQLGNRYQKEDHFYRQSADYKRYVDGGRKPSLVGFPAQFDTAQQSLRDMAAQHKFYSQVLHRDGKVKCTQDRECKPSFRCKGACLLWG